jgi:hypothetical protein
MSSQGSGEQGDTTAKPVRITQDQLDHIAENIAPLEERHRAAMLDLILMWGTLDGALGMLLSTMEDLPYSHGADMYGDLPSSTKFARMRKVLKRSSEPAAAKASKKLKSYKKTYERCSDIRNFIAHSHCPGIWTIDRDCPSSDFLRQIAVRSQGGSGASVE